MVQLILIRPGITEYDQQARIQGILDIPITEAGRREAEQAAEKLRKYQPVAIYHSPREASKETADIIAGALGLKSKTIKNLHNLKQGLWQGMLIEEVRHKQPKVYKQWQEHPESVRAPEGEIISEALQRIDEALEKLLRKHTGETIVLVAPEPLASLIRHAAEGTELGDLWKAVNGCTRCEVLQLQPALATAGTHGKSPAPSHAGGLNTTVSKKTIAESR